MNIKTNNYSSPAFRLYSCKSARRIICASTFSGSTTPVDNENTGFGGYTPEMTDEALNNQ